MKISILFLHILFSTFAFSQKFAIIENSGDNSKYFNYNDPNSFVGVLINNLNLIPKMVENNNFYGVYDSWTLERYKLPENSMLTFESGRELKINEGNYAHEIYKTNQTFKEFKDSVKFIPEYADLIYYDSIAFQKIWDNSMPYSRLMFWNKYYFDIRNLSAFLLEETDNEIWIHCIKQNSDGKNFISLSLKQDQLKESNCFNFWKFLTDNESKEFLSTYKSEAFEQLNKEEFKLWTKGRLYYRIMNEDINFNEKSCWVTSERIKFNEDIRYPFSLNVVELDKLQTTRKKQEIGSVINYPRIDLGDELTLVREEGSFQDFLNSTMIDQVELLSNFVDLQKLWEETKIGSEIRLPKDSILVWKEIPNAKIAISYTLDKESRSKLKSNTNSAIIYVDENNQKTAILDYSKDYQSQQFPLTNSIIDKIEIDLSKIANWNSLIYTKTNSATFSEIQKSLNLINVSTDLN